MEMGKADYQKVKKNIVYLWDKLSLEAEQKGIWQMNKRPGTVVIFYKGK